MKAGRRIWVKLFVNIALIFVLFVTVISIAGSTLFVEYFAYRQQKQMKECAQQIATLDYNDRSSAADSLRNAERQYNVTVTVYNNGVPIYTTIGATNGLRPNISGFDMIINRPDLFGEVVESKADGEYGKVSRVTLKGKELLIYTYTPKGSVSVDVITEQSLIENSAQVAGEFTILIATACLIVALIWSVAFARRFTRPIERMNKIALQMAALDFSQKVEVERNDEIGALGSSLNRLSEALLSTLKELNERNRRLQKEIDAERRLDSMRKGFVANVSHELKTPIAIIQGYAEGLEGGLAEDEALRQKYSRVIIEESQRMNGLIMSLLELSKYEGTLSLNEEEYDVCPSLINLADRNGQALIQKQIELDIKIPESLIVIGDRLMTEQAVQNYLSNAISHTEQGGKITLYTESYGDDGMRICVHNTGAQIPQKDMENLWQSFWRADKAHSRDQGRFGLGLSVVKAIMCAAKLDFGVFNTENGVTFWIQVRQSK
ncbi:MAG: HAMP domain-containing protein [Clostridia bacterium]|nr:HAMP domain-containing protein [Clostridia bacterium]